MILQWYFYYYYYYYYYNPVYFLNCPSVSPAAKSKRYTQNVLEFLKAVTFYILMTLKLNWCFGSYFWKPIYKITCIGEVS